MAEERLVVLEEPDGCALAGSVFSPSVGNRVAMSPPPPRKHTVPTPPARAQVCLWMQVLGSLHLPKKI